MNSMRHRADAEISSVCRYKAHSSKISVKALTSCRAKLPSYFFANIFEDIDVKRECILKSLMVYLNEDPKSVFKDYGMDEVEDAENDVGTTMMGIFVFKRAEHGFADDVWIIVEGVKVISRAGSVIMAFTILFGLIYALDLSYPGNLQHTFEFVQKVIMHMDGHRLNSKIQQLKMKMFQ